MIARFFTRISVDLFPTWTRFFLSGLIDFVQTRLGRDDGRGIPKMSTMLTELVRHLQDVHTHHLNGDGRLMVAVPTTPHTVEQFEVREVHHDGPSVVLHCQPLQDEQARPQEEQARPPAKKPGLASITTTRICSDEVGQVWLRTTTGSFRFAPVNRQRIVQIGGGAD